MAENRLSVAHIQIVVDAGTDTVREDKFVIGRISGHWFISESNNFKCRRYLGKNELQVIGSILAESKSDVEKLIEWLESAQHNSRYTLAQAYQNNEVAKAILGYSSMIISQDNEIENSSNDLQNSAMTLLQKSGAIISSELQQKSQLLAAFQKQLSRYLV